MNLLNIKVPVGTNIAVVGDIHEHDYQFYKLLDLIQPSEKMFLVSVGDIYDKGFGVDKAEAIIDNFAGMSVFGFGFVVQGNHEIKKIKKTKPSERTPQLEWFSEQPLVVSFVFNNGTRLTVLHGGVTPKHVWSDLNQDIETSYVRTIDSDGEAIPLRWIEKNGLRSLRPAKENGVTWHQLYDGRFGYIAAGHEPLKDGIPKYYNYSCNLDTACYCTGILSCQIFSENGLDRYLAVNGPAKKKGSG